MSEYRQRALDRYGEECAHCGAGEQVKVHHMDGDHSHDRLDNWIPLCQECHVGLHRGAPPYTIWFAIGRPVVQALDEYRRSGGYRSRSEALARLLTDGAGGELSTETWSLLQTHTEAMYGGEK